MRQLSININLGLLLACLVFAGAARAQTWPTQTVTMIVPLPAGGPADTVARALAPMMEQVWKQPFLIENKPGAGGRVGSAFVASAKPDGYTLLFLSNGAVTANLFSKIALYDPADLRAVVETARSSYLIVTHPTIPARSLREMIALAREKGKALNYGTIPFGTYDLDNHLFLQKAGIDMTPVPYNGAAPLNLAAVRGDIQLYMGILGPLVPLVKEGRLVPLAVTGTQRNPMLPNVPTAREQGLDFVAGYMVGIWASSKTPEPVVAKIGADVSAVVLSPAYAARLKDLNHEVPPQPLGWPERVQTEIKAYSDMARQLGIQPE